jgi:hypothetical protein
LIEDGDEACASLGNLRKDSKHRSREWLVRRGRKRGRAPERVCSVQVASGADSEFAQYGCPRTCGYTTFTHTQTMNLGSVSLIILAPYGLWRASTIHFSHSEYVPDSNPLPSYHLFRQGVPPTIVIGLVAISPSDNIRGGSAVTMFDSPQCLMIRVELERQVSSCHKLARSFFLKTLILHLQIQITFTGVSHPTDNSCLTSRQEERRAFLENVLRLGSAKEIRRKNRMT